jgi:SNF2 family DNA or RNA helicase
MEFVLAEEDETKLSTKIIANAESEFLIKERERTLEIKTKITALRKLIKTKKTTKQIETLSKKLLQPEHITIEFQNKTKQVEEENSLTHGLYLDNTTNRYKDDGDLKSFNCRIKNITKPETISIEGLQVPEEIYNHLFGYQKTCLKWLWELNKQKTGGVLGDEMGLGKMNNLPTTLTLTLISDKSNLMAQY